MELEQLPQQEVEEFDPQALSLVEHWFLGSSIPVDGTVLSTSEMSQVIRRAMQGDEQARKQAFSPIGFQEGSLSEQDVRRIRAHDARRMNRKGYVAFLASKSLGSFMSEELSFYVEPSPIGDNNMVANTWRIKVFGSDDEQITEDVKLVNIRNRMVIDPEKKDIISIQPTPQDNSIIVTIPLT